MLNFQNRIVNGDSLEELKKEQKEQEQEQELQQQAQNDEILLNDESDSVVIDMPPDLSDLKDLVNQLGINMQE